MSILHRIRQLLKGSSAPDHSLAATASAADANGPVWCVVANVLIERPHGPGGGEIRSGTKHFAPGAKVHVVHYFWGMGGERVTVVGRHRKSKRYITLVMQADHLANWRAELVYSPHVIRHVLEHRGFSGPEPQAHAEQIAASYNKNGAARQPFTTRPPSTEPLPAPDVERE